MRWLLGREADAIAALRRALAISIDGPHVPTELMASAELARLLASTDESEAAEHLARCGELLASGEDWRGQAGAVELARGAVASAQGRHDDADAAHARALATFTTFQLPWKRAETLRSWAQCCTTAGRATEADERRRASAQIYEELDARRRWSAPP